MIKSFRFAISALSLIFLFNACSKSKDAEPVSTGKAFTSFVFKIIQNPALPQDISCEIIGDTVYAYCFSGTDITALKPVFAYDGAAVSVGNFCPLFNYIFIIPRFIKQFNNQLINRINEFNGC